MTTTVLADCPTCDAQRDCAIEDCDDCFLKFRDIEGGDPEKYDGTSYCTHLRCTACGTALGGE